MLPLVPLAVGEKKNCAACLHFPFRTEFFKLMCLPHVVATFILRAAAALPRCFFPLSGQMGRAAQTPAIRTSTRHFTE